MHVYSVCAERLKSHINSFVHCNVMLILKLQRGRGHVLINLFFRLTNINATACVKFLSLFPSEVTWGCSMAAMEICSTWCPWAAGDSLLLCGPLLGCMELLLCAWSFSCPPSPSEQFKVRQPISAFERKQREVFLLQINSAK